MTIIAKALLHRGVVPAIVVAVVTVATTPLAASEIAQAADLEGVWKGKTVTISVGYRPGGGADIMSRILAVHMAKRLPGNPAFIIANRPGGGTTTNARDMVRRPADGTYIGQFAQTLMVSGVLGTAPDWFKWDEYGYLGMPEGAGADSFYPVCGRTAVMKNLEDFLAGKDWRWGEISPETGAGKDLKWFSLTKFPIRAFYGFGGSAEVAAAFDRGEMDVTGRCSEQEAIRYPHWFKDNQVVPLFGWGELNPDRHVPPNNPISNGLREGRWPWFKDFRTALKHLVTDDQMAAFNAMYSLSGTHVFAVPPGMQPHILEAMQKAFYDTITSPEFREDMTKRDRRVDPLGGEETRARVQAIADMNPGAKAVMLEIFGN